MKTKLKTAHIVIRESARNRLKVIAAKRGRTIRWLVEEFAKTLKA